jgi:hypothetical protein
MEGKSYIAVLTLQNELQFILTMDMYKFFQAGPFKYSNNTWLCVIKVNWLLPFVKILYQCSYALLIKGIILRK